MNDDFKNARSILVGSPSEKGVFSWLSGYLSACEAPSEMLKAKVRFWSQSLETLRMLQAD